jgi:hypothetical protein
MTDTPVSLFLNSNKTRFGIVAVIEANTPIIKKWVFL